jgi:predicted permease
MFSGLGTESRHALRQFRHHPLYALASAGTLAVAIGAAGATGTVVKQALVDPLPYPDGDRLVMIRTATGGPFSATSLHVVEDLRAARDLFSAVAPVLNSTSVYTTPAGSENVPGHIVTPDYFELFGARPALGRLWSPGERHVVVISWRFWQRALGGDPTAIGTSLTLSGQPHQIIAVLPEDFLAPFYPAMELWRPADIPSLLAAQTRDTRSSTPFARLAVGVDPARLDAAMETFSRGLQAAHPAVHGRQAWTGKLLRDELVGPTRPALIGAMAAGVILLLTVLANLAGLSAARALHDRVQTAVRQALGASHARLVMGPILESIFNAGIGTAAGVLLAYGLVAAAASYQPQFLGRMPALAMDLSTMLAIAAVGFLAGTCAAALPRVLVGKGRATEAVRASRTGASSRAAASARTVLVTGQVALTVILLVGAGLLVRTVYHLSTVPLGFDDRDLTVVYVALPGAHYTNEAAQITFERNVLARLAQNPVVTGVSASVGIPVIGGTGAALAIRDRPADSVLTEIAYLSVSPEFSGTWRTELVAGRDLLMSDTLTSPPVVVVNETMARRFWPQGDAVGARIRLGPDPGSPWMTVVGVTADLRQHGPTEDIRPTAFGSTLQYSRPRRYVTVRTSADGATASAILRDAIRAEDPTLVPGQASTVQRYIEQRTGQYRLFMLTFAALGATALVVCGFGLFVVITLTSRQRRREYAIRIALGAPRSQVTWLVLRQAVILTTAGACLGLGVAAAGTRILSGALHGVAPTDAPTFVMTTAIVFVLSAAAAWWPARQADRINPTDVLRLE